MWPFEKKSSAGKETEQKGDLWESLLTLKTSVRALEREMEEQHDFLRRLASRRAKEVQVENKVERQRNLRLDAESDDEPVGRGHKNEIWARVKAKRGLQ